MLSFTNLDYPYSLAQSLNRKIPIRLIFYLKLYAKFDLGHDLSTEEDIPCINYTYCYWIDVFAGHQVSRRRLNSSFIVYQIISFGKLARYRSFPELRSIRYYTVLPVCIRSHSTRLSLRYQCVELSTKTSWPIRGSELHILVRVPSNKFFNDGRGPVI